MPTDRLNTGSDGQIISCKNQSGNGQGVVLPWWLPLSYYALLTKD